MSLLVVALGMFGFGYALVPLYEVICEITGFNGRTGGQIAQSSLDGVVDRERTVTVEFLGTVNSGLAWDFEPVERTMVVRPGELYETHFYARNKARSEVVGRAVPSVSPNAAAPHFSKTECFCFTEQRFAAGEGREMPLRFVVSRDLPPGITTVTLSYTFFNVDDKT